MKIDKKLIKELVENLKEFNLTELEYQDGQTKIKVLNKQLKAIDPFNNKIITNTSSKIYDLVILCLGPKSKIYKKLLGNREIGRDYYEQSITGNVKHNIRDLPSGSVMLIYPPFTIETK